VPLMLDAHAILSWMAGTLTELVIAVGTDVTAGPRTADRVAMRIDPAIDAATAMKTIPTKPAIAVSTERTRTARRIRETASSQPAESAKLCGATCGWGRLKVR